MTRRKTKPYAEKLLNMSYNQIRKEYINNYVKSQVLLAILNKEKEYIATYSLNKDISYKDLYNMFLGIYKSLDDDGFRSNLYIPEKGSDDKFGIIVNLLKYIPEEEWDEDDYFC